MAACCSLAAVLRVDIIAMDEGIKAEVLLEARCVCYSATVLGLWGEHGGCTGWGWEIVTQYNYFFLRGICLLIQICRGTLPLMNAVASNRSQHVNY